MAYDKSTRVVSRFGIPLAGLWRFDVMVDQQKYGDIVVDVPDSAGSRVRVSFRRF